MQPVILASAKANEPPLLRQQYHLFSKARLMEAPPPIKRYNLMAPTEQDVFSALDRLVGSEESRRLWASACEQAGLRRNQASLSMEQLESALQHLKQAKGLPSIAANSMLVRVKGYRTLSLLNSM